MDEGRLRVRDDEPLRRRRLAVLLRVVLDVPHAIVLTVWTIWWALARRRSPMVRTGLLGVPIALTCGVFAMLLLSHFSAAAVFAVLALACVAGWHWHEPEEDAG